MSEYSGRDLFEAFVFMRRQGATPDFALQYLKKLRPSIKQHERDELAQQIRQWEKTEGHHYPPNLDARIDLPPPPVLDNDQDSQEDIVCPNCETINQPRATYCYSCGTLLTRAGTKQFVDSDGTEPEGANFGNLSSLVFTVRGFEDNPLHIDMQDAQEVIVGRTAPDSVIVPDIDLTNHNAQNTGVSRVHATLKRQDANITVTDMGSMNHTYLNGERIYPQEVRILRDGDELRLGRLVMRVAFQRQLRRISRE